MKVETISTNSVRRGKVCSICRLVVKPGQKGLWAGTGAWHYQCVHDLIFQESGYFVIEPESVTSANHAVDLQFENYKADLLRRLEDDDVA